MNKWYMLNPEFFLENETHKILWDHLISSRRPDLVIVKKKQQQQKTNKQTKQTNNPLPPKNPENLPISEICCSSWPQAKTVEKNQPPKKKKKKKKKKHKKKQKSDYFLNHAGKVKKKLEHESDGDTKLVQ